MAFILELELGEYFILIWQNQIKLIFNQLAVTYENSLIDLLEHFIAPFVTTF